MLMRLAASPALSRTVPQQMPHSLSPGSLYCSPVVVLQPRLQNPQFPLQKHPPLHHIPHYRLPARLGQAYQALFLSPQHLLSSHWGESKIRTPHFVVVSMDVARKTTLVYFLLLLQSISAPLLDCPPCLLMFGRLKLLGTFDDPAEVAVYSSIFRPLVFSDKIGGIDNWIIAILLALGEAFAIFNPVMQDSQFPLMFVLLEKSCARLVPSCGFDYVGVVGNVRMH